MLLGGILLMKIIFYGVFYFFLIVFFIYIFVKEKDLVKKFDVYRENFVNKIIEKYNIKNENNIKYFKKSFYYIEILGIVFILVVII